MKVKAALFSLFLSVCALVVSCDPSRSTHKLEATTIEPTDSSIALETNTNNVTAPSEEPTDTSIVEAPSIEQAQPQENAEFAELVIKCLEILPSPPETAELNGSIFFDKAVGSTSPPFLLDMQSREKIFLPDLEDDGLYYTINPGRSLVAYYSFRTGTNQLVVMSSNGQEQVVVDWNFEEWQGIAYWLDNENLAISFREFRPYDIAPPIIIIDINTGNMNEYAGAYPHISESSAYDYGWITSTFYDPTISRVAYIAYRENALGLVLWDLHEEKIIGEISPWQGVFDNPKWSPDGRILLTINDISSEQDISNPNSEFFIMTYNGETQRITQLTTYYELSRIGRFEWSPNSKYVAFWFENSVTDDFETLAVLDLEMNRVTNYCVPGNQLRGKSGDIVWSPNSRLLVIDNISEESESISREIIIDIEEEYAAVIAENMNPIAWLTNSP